MFDICNGKGKGNYFSVVELPVGRPWRTFLRGVEHAAVAVTAASARGPSSTCPPVRTYSPPGSGPMGARPRTGLACVYHHSQTKYGLVAEMERHGLRHGCWAPGGRCHAIICCRREAMRLPRGHVSREEGGGELVRTTAISVSHLTASARRHRQRLRARRSCASVCVRAARTRERSWARVCSHVRRSVLVRKSPDWRHSSASQVAPSLHACAGVSRRERSSREVPTAVVL